MSAVDAGREMDSEIAELVFGATIHEGFYDDYMTLPGDGMVSGQRPIPNYSTDIAAAWLVVEKLRSSHGFREVSVSHFDGLWRFALWIDPEDDYEAMEQADTAPLAICRAALAAPLALSPQTPPHGAATPTVLHWRLAYPADDECVPGCPACRPSLQTPPHTEGE